MGILSKPALSVLATLAGAIFVLPACSDDEPGADEKSDSSESPTAPDVGGDEGDEGDEGDAATAVSEFYGELAAGDLPTACSWWTQDYTELSIDRWNEGDFGKRIETCPDLLREITEVATLLEEASVVFEVADVSAELTGDDTARVEVSLASGTGEPEVYEVTRTAVGWRISGDEAGDLTPTESASPTR